MYDITFFHKRKRKHNHNFLGQLFLAFSVFMRKLKNISFSTIVGFFSTFILLNQNNHHPQKKNQNNHQCVTEYIELKYQEAQRSRLYYVDDTLLIGEVTLDCLCIFKTVLKCFELTSDLQVNNFNKSCVMGVNVNNTFLGIKN